MVLNKVSGIARFARRVGRGLGNGVKFVFSRFWGHKDREDFFRLFWRTLQTFFVSCAASIAPALKILKKDLLKLGKMSFSSFHFFLEKMLRKAVIFLMEFLKHLLKNDRFFKQTAFYLAVLLSILVFIFILKWFSNVFF